MQDQQTLTSADKNEILTGLRAKEKYISSKYFYDDRGSLIFSEIMRMPEYYLTDCEYEIFDLHKESIFKKIHDENRSFDLVELGAGDGLKTSVLIEYLLSKNSVFTYVPVDISKTALDDLVDKMKEKYPQLNISGQEGDYFKVLEDLNYCDTCKKTGLFLGSNIGNYPPAQAIAFFKHLSRVLNPGDMILTGFDLVKDPDIILEAYDDPAGITNRFNFNLLTRLNREFGASFSENNFLHYAVYEPGEKAAKSYLISKIDQEIRFENLNTSIHFGKWEPIFTEMSRKFTPEDVEQLANDSGYRIVENYYDKRKYFLDSLWVRE